MGIISSYLIYQLIYQLFWTQACLEGMCTNGTHGSHASCHPKPLPQPLKVGHTIGVYDPYSFRIVSDVRQHFLLSYLKTLSVGPVGV